MNIESFIPFFSDYGILILLLGGIFGGEEVIITLVFLSAMGVLPLWWIIVFVTIGEYISDIIVFSIGRIKLLHKFNKIEKLARIYQKANNLIIKVSRGKIFLTLLYTKFIYGTRILGLVYLGTRKTQWKKFIVFDFIVVIIWISVTIAIGWLGSNGVKQITGVFKNIELTIALLILFIGLIVLMKKWIRTKLLKQQKQLN